MTAAVKAAGNRRAPSQIGVFFHRQRVHVGAEPNAFAALALALEHPDHAGAADTAMHLDAPLRQFVGDDAGGAHFLEADLGMSVKVAPNSGEFVGETFDAV